MSVWIFCIPSCKRLMRREYIIMVMGTIPLLTERIAIRCKYTKSCFLENNKETKRYLVVNYLTVFCEIFTIDAEANSGTVYLLTR